MTAPSPLQAPPELASRAQDPAPTARPLSTPAAIGISGLTAAIVMGAGVLIADRTAPPRPTEPLPPPPRPTVLLPPESAAIPASAPPIAASAAPPPVAASVVASAAAPEPAPPPAATVEPAAGDAPRDPSQLPERRGYLLVHGPSGARVYIKDEAVGAVDEAIVVPCGLAFVRLGTLLDGGRHPTWIGAGQSVVIACRAETRVEAGLPVRP